jgi:predicted HTH transcriptional regulator
MRKVSSSAVQMEQDFLTFEAFLTTTAKDDRAFLGGCAFLDDDERRRFAAACCGMANGDGGWVVFGAEYAGRQNEKDVFSVEGVADAELLEQELRAVLSDDEWLSADLVSSFYSISSRAPSPYTSPNDHKTVLAVRVETADWFLRPVCVCTNFLRGIGVSSDVSSRAAYRRVEGNDVMSGLGARYRMALDALERARDDRPVPGLSARELDIESVVSFRRAVLGRYPRWANLSEINFLKRVLVLDDDEKVTRAGQLLLGAPPESSKENDSPLLLRRNGKETLFASNLWSAYSDILPELRDSLFENCAGAVHECFMNALLHADYDAGRVEIDMNIDMNITDANINEEGKEGGFIRFSNPGLPRVRGTGNARNYRLLRMFRLAGVVREAQEKHEKHRKRGEERAGGLEIIRAYDESFRLEWDTLDLFTRAELRLERIREAKVQEVEVHLTTSLGWLPVVGDESVSPAETTSEKNARLGLKRIGSHAASILLTSSDSGDGGEPEGAEAKNGGSEDKETAMEKVLSEKALSEEAVNEETIDKEEIVSEAQNEKTEDAEDEEYPESEKDGDGDREDEAEEAEEYLDEDDDIGFVPEFASLEELVRTTPRLQASVVREAILEFCGEYRSLSELAAALARSETSLRRHYISAMVREGLLEMEFPDKVGHAAQRYRVTGRQKKAPKKNKG